MAKLNVYVPDALRKRMREFDDQVDWSPIACLAFAQKLAELAAKKGKKTMKETIDRLRASKMEGEEERDWYEAGWTWGSERAEWAELERVQEWEFSVDAVWTKEGGLSHMPPNAATGKGWLEHVFPGVKGAAGERAFWKKWGVGGAVPTADQLLSFHSGALRVYETAEEEL
jgi:hypothetical protein